MSEFLHTSGESSASDRDQNEQSNKWANMAETLDVNAASSAPETEEAAEAEPQTEEVAEAEPQVEVKADIQEEAESASKAEEGAETESQVEGDIYDHEHRREVNRPIHDLFAKRRKAIAKKFPVLVMTDIAKYVNDPEYQAEKDAEYAKVPKEVQDEFHSMGRIMGRLRDGIAAPLKPGDEWASSSPNYVPKEVKTENGSVIATVWKAAETGADLEKLAELHEKNSEIVDFSGEDEEDIDSIPENIQEVIDKLGDKIKELEGASVSDFRSFGDERPKAAEVIDMIYKIQATEEMSLEAHEKLNKTRNEFMREYLLAEQAAELRSINENIAYLESRKEEIAKRQEKVKNAKFVAKLFQRLTQPNLEEDLEDEAESINTRIADRQAEIEQIKKRRIA